MEGIGQYNASRVIKSARGLLHWTQEDLARRSGVSLSTLNRLERQIGECNGTSLRLIYRAFREAGLFFEVRGTQITIGIHVTEAIGEVTGAATQSAG